MRILPANSELGSVTLIKVASSLQVPQSEKDWKEIANEFAERWNFSNCIGAMDGKHIAIRPPPNTGSYYFNYKGFFSIVLLAVVDADYQFTYIDVGCNGRISDGGVFKNCSLNRALEENTLNIPSNCQLPGTDVCVPYALVADDAFPLKRYILKPYSQRNLTRTKQIFNYRLSRARRIVENAFGVLANRFRIFMHPIAVESSKIEVIVMVTVSLHNFLRKRLGTSTTYMPSYDNENLPTEEIEFGEWRKGSTSAMVPLLNENHGKATDAAMHARDVIAEYFCSKEGEVPWQWKMI